MDYNREHIIDYINDELDTYSENELYQFDSDGELEWSQLHNELFNQVYFVPSFEEAVAWFDDDVEKYVEVQRFVSAYHSRNYADEIEWFDILDQE